MTAVAVVMVMTGVAVKTVVTVVTIQDPWVPRILGTGRGYTRAGRIKDTDQLQNRTICINIVTQ